MKKLLSLLLLLGLSANLFAQTIYGGLSVGLGTTLGEFIDTSERTSSGISYAGYLKKYAFIPIKLKGGYFLTENHALGGMLGLGLGIEFSPATPAVLNATAIDFGFAYKFKNGMFAIGLTPILAISMWSKDSDNIGIQFGLGIGIAPELVYGSFGIGLDFNYKANLKETKIEGKGLEGARSTSEISGHYIDLGLVFSYYL